MCGLTGFWQPLPARPLSAAALDERLNRMTNRLIHRGPDAAGTWTDPAVGLALGFRRLAIRELSPAGAQPMTSASGQTVIAFNGEIYNAEEMRAALASTNRSLNYRGTSDTEVLLEAIESWGLQTAFKKAVGMFAVAVWDRRQRQLHLVRDRFGEKPLYYGVNNGTLIFGSELKALREHPAFPTEVDRGAMTGLVRHGYVPGPSTIYRGTRKLEPGTFVSFREQDVSFERLPTPVPYWNLDDVFARGQERRFTGRMDEAVSELDRLLKRTVREQMASDVPLGAFLSGGIDSSLIVALMRESSHRAVRTFTIGFEDRRYNEADYGAAVARHLKTDHTELIVTEKQALDVIPRLAEIYDEPFADSSQIPTFLVAQLARKHVTVSLSGDGGDEQFGGYSRYAGAMRMWRQVGWLPRPARALASKSLLAIPGIASSSRGSLMRKLYWGAKVMSAPDFNQAYRGLMSYWGQPREVLLRSENTADLFAGQSIADRYRRMMRIDAGGYLPDDILVKVDRATMAVSLESRSPFLDHRIAEFASTLPTSMLVHRGKGKRILRKLLERYVPKAMFDRPKMGFGVPIGNWLRRSLREWADDLLSEKRLAADGFWNAAVVRSTWEDHAEGRVDASARLWPILMFQCWQDAQRQQSRARRAA